MGLLKQLITQTINGGTITVVSQTLSEYLKQDSIILQVLLISV